MTNFPGGPCCVLRVWGAVVVWVLPYGAVRSYGPRAVLPSLAANGTSVSWFRGTSRASPPHSTGCCCCKTRQRGDGPSGLPPATAPVQLCLSHVFAFTCSPGTGAEFLIKQTFMGYSKDANRWHKASSAADVKSCQKEPGSAFPLWCGRTGWLRAMPRSVAKGIAPSSQCRLQHRVPRELCWKPSERYLWISERRRISFFSNWPHSKTAIWSQDSVSDSSVEEDYECSEIWIKWSTLENPAHIWETASLGIKKACLSKFYKSNKGCLALNSQLGAFRGLNAVQGTCDF